MRRAVLGMGLLALVVGAVALAGGFRSSSPVTGRPAPALPTSVLVAPRVSLSSLHGHVTLVNFWASWCGPCRREAPILESFAHRFRGRARLVGVNWNDGSAGAKSFLRKYSWTFPNLRDADGTVGNAYGITGLPATFVLDTHGRIVRRLSGPQTLATLGRAVDAGAESDG